jgi:hypothetical protein
MQSVLGDVPEADVLAARLTRLPKAAENSTAGLIRSLQAWTESLDGEATPGHLLTQERFHLWADERRDEPENDYEVPRDKGVWVRLFDGWTRALAAAGLLAQRCTDPRFTAFGLESENDVTLLYERIREYVVSHGRVPDRKAYNTWARAMRLEAARRNEIVIYPCPHVGISEHTSWAFTLLAAGVISPPKAARIHARTRARYTDEQVVEAIVLAISAWLDQRDEAAQDRAKRKRGRRREFGGNFYVEWREGELETRAEAGDPAPLPSEKEVRHRLGGFPGAVRVALEHAPELKHRFDNHVGRAGEEHAPREEGAAGEGLAAGEDYVTAEAFAT